MPASVFQRAGCPPVKRACLRSIKAVTFALSIVVPVPAGPGSESAKTALIYTFAFVDVLPYTGGMDSIVKTLKALGDPVRLHILEFLQHPDRSCCNREDSVCACDIEAKLDLAQPTISHHMKILVDAGLVTAEKRGRWMFYELREDTFDELIVFLGGFRPDGARPAIDRHTTPVQGGH
jgi:ArsR family transcriptional regulator, arsenate/arsenite/antimonite-responsive transcriptional repressor